MPSLKALLPCLALALSSPPFAAGEPAGLPPGLYAEFITARGGFVCELFADQARAARGPANPLTPADLAKYSVDAMLDLLIFRFEPKP